MDRNHPYADSILRDLVTKTTDDNFAEQFNQIPRRRPFARSIDGTSVNMLNNRDDVLKTQPITLDVFHQNLDGPIIVVLAPAIATADLTTSRPNKKTTKFEPVASLRLESEQVSSENISTFLTAVAALHSTRFKWLNEEENFEQALFSGDNCDIPFPGV